MVKLRWKPAFQATSYNIIRNGTQIDEVGETFYTDMDLEMGQIYCYQIVVHGDGYDISSNEICVLTPALPCSAPTGLTGQFVDSGCEACAILVKWLAPEDRVPDSYTVTFTDLINDFSFDVTGITETSYEDEVPFAVPVNYSYKVRAVYPECESDFALTNSGEDHVTLSNVSVDENPLANVKLYPNPASGQMTIEADGLTSVRVYNPIGQFVMEMAANDGSAVLDLSTLQSGIYMVKVCTPTGTVMQTVVKM